MANETETKRDRRGTPTGKGTITPAHGGRIGNPRFEPTDEQRTKVRELAQVFPMHGEHMIARLIGIGRTTLREYFAEDIEIGRAEAISVVGRQMLDRAMNANAPAAKGDMDAMKFFLARMGGWTTKVEIGDKAARPFGGEVDLSHFSEEELEEYRRLCLIAEGRDPSEATSDDD